MDFASITQFGGALAALVPVLLVIGFVVVLRRTESLHILMRRIWLLVHGRQEISDPTIRAFVDEQTNLMSFRMFSGVRAASLEEAHQLIEWTKLNRVDIHKVGACGDYFDTALRQVRKHKFPSTPYALTQIALFLAFLFGTLICGWLITVPQVPFTLKATQRTFLANASSAQTVWPPLIFNRQPLRGSDCEQPAANNAARTSFTEMEVATLCKVLTSKEWPENFQSKLKEQRWVLSLLVATFGLIAYWCFLPVNRLLQAKALAARGISPVLSGSQSELELPTT